MKQKIDDDQRKFLRHLIDVVWMYINESQEVPATSTADKLIDKAMEPYDLNDKDNERVYDVQVDVEDDVMSVEDWEAAVDDGFFHNEDGSGYWVKNGLACRNEVFSSEPLDATHMVWYNK